MRIYVVSWTFDKSSDFDGRLPLDQKLFHVVVLASSRAHALAAFEHLFKDLHWKDGLSIDHGDINIHIMKVDSRNIIANYLMIHDMKEPLHLTSLNPLNIRRAFAVYP